MFGWKQRTDSGQTSSLRTECNAACADRKVMADKLGRLEREHARTHRRLATVTEVAGEMAAKRLAIERDLALVRQQLKTAMTLLETVRSVPELVLEIVNEGRQERVVYERAEKLGISREVESVQQVHAILLAMKSSRVVGDARERLLLERIHMLRKGGEEPVEPPAMSGVDEADTRKVQVDYSEQT
jgi:hypothetical protein